MASLFESYGISEPEAEAQSPPKKAETGEFKKGFGRSFDELPSLAAGVGAYAADVVGADGARDSMLKYAKDRSEQTEKDYGSDAASFTNVMDGKAGAGDFIANAAGYVAGQALMSIATGGVGALGAKMLAKQGIKVAGEKFAAEALAKELAAGATQEMAFKAATQATAGFMKSAATKAGIKGATVGAGTQNLNMELGSIYPDAVDQAHADGRELDGGDLARVLGSSVVAAGVDTAMEAFNAKKILGGGKGVGLAGRAAREIPVGMARESATEGVQTAIEHYGAGAPIADEKGRRDIVDSMAVGAVGGGLAGAGASVHAAPADHTDVITQAEEPGSVLSRAAVAGNPEVAAQAADPYSQKARALEKTIRDGGLVQRMRDIGGEQHVGDLLYALGIAKNPGARPEARQEALDSIDTAMGWMSRGATPDVAGTGTPFSTDLTVQPQAQQPGTDLATMPGSQLTSPGMPQAFDPNTIDGEAVRTDNMVGGPKALPAPPGPALTGPAATQPTQTPALAGVSTSTPESTANGTETPQAVQAEAQGQEAPAGPAAVIQPKARTQVPAPEVAIPAGQGPAMLRKAKAQAQAMVAQGYDTVERRDDGYFLVNHGTNAEMRLDNAGAAQVARAAIREKIDADAHVAPSSPLNDKRAPTAGQIAAENYHKPVTSINGFKVRIENPEASTRSGTSPDGKKWESKMHAHYGEIEGSRGADGDKVDVFIGSRPDSDKIFVIDQKNQDGSFDEHKVMMGYTNLADAKAGYLKNYEKGWTGLAAITEMSVPDFRAWLKSPASMRPVSDYSFTPTKGENNGRTDAASTGLDKEPGRGDVSHGADDGSGDQLLAKERGRVDSQGATEEQGAGADEKSQRIERAVSSNEGKLSSERALTADRLAQLKALLATSTDQNEREAIQYEIHRSPNLETPPADVLKAFAALASRWSAQFGTDGIAGYYDKGTGASDGFESGGVFFVNLADPHMALQWTIGHEFEHATDRLTENSSHPADVQLQRMRDVLWGMISAKGQKEFFEGVLFKGQSHEKATPSQLRTLKKEMLAEFMGARFADRKWLESLAKQKPALFGTFVREWIDMLNNVIESLRSAIGLDADSKKNVDKYIAELDKAKAMAMGVAENWVKRNPKLAQTSTGSAQFSSRMDEINELGNFNLDFTDLDDLDMVEYLEEQSKLQLQQELAYEEQHAPKKSKQAEVSVTESDIHNSGVNAERAYPQLHWEDQEGLGMQLTSVIPNLYGDSKPGRITLDEEPDTGGLWGATMRKTWVGPANTESIGWSTKKAAQEFAQRFVASKDLVRRGFDLINAIPQDKVTEIVKSWKEISDNEPNIRKLQKASKKAKSLESIADSMGIGRDFDVSVTEDPVDLTHKSTSIQFVDRKTGQMQEASFDTTKVDDKTFLTAHTTTLNRNGLGAAFYQLISEYAAHKGMQITPDDSLSGVNTYRRTEQGLAAALRTGVSNVMIPHPTQRVYGFNADANTEEEHQENISRMLLAGLRNARELAPGIENLVYIPITGVFIHRGGGDAESVVTKMLEDTDARAFGLGRSTLARAALTQQMLDGVINKAAMVDFAEPVLYSTRDDAQFEYQSIKDRFEGTAQWMKAPDGTSTKLEERQWIQVRTESFKNWFGDWEKAHANGGVWAHDDVSKVVGENGEPLVVYHGTDHGGFYEFNTPSGRGRGDLGIFTTSNESMADSYVRKGRADRIALTGKPETKEALEALDYTFPQMEDGRFEAYDPDGYFQGVFDTEAAAVKDTLDNFEDAGEADKPGVYAAFMNLREPGEDNFEGAMWGGERNEQWIIVNDDGDQIYADDGKGYFNEDELDTQLQSLNAKDVSAKAEPAPDHHTSTDGFVSDARRSKYDGAIIREVVDDGGGRSSYSYEPSDLFVAFKPGQLKSAEWNTGEFGNSDDLRYSERQTDTDAFKAWFGKDSTMVNIDGSPMVLFHGTTKANARSIGEFKRSKIGAMGPAIYLGDSREASAGYDDGAMMEVYARGKYASNAQWSEYVSANGWAGAEAAAKKDGFSGVYDTQFENAIAVWDAKDIKSATDNDGGFSSENPDIRRSERPADFTDPSARTEVSTTVPKAMKDGQRINDAVDQKWIIDAQDVANSSTHLAAASAAIKEYNSVDFAGKSDALEALRDTVIDNLVWLHDLVPPAVRSRAKLWYDGANRMANGMSEKFGIDVRQAAGVFAVLSPQKDWFMNTSLGERVVTAVKRHGHEPWSSDMTAWVKSYVKASKTVDERVKRAKLLAIAERSEGKPLTSLPLKDAAVFVRVFDETYFPRNYRVVTPEGGFGEFVVTSSSEKDESSDDVPDGSVAWGGYGTIEKAVAILRDNDQQTMIRTISDSLGGEHKVRNFYNNIVSPGSADGHVTIDTHAVAAALFKALSGGSTEVLHNFGSTTKGLPGAGGNADSGAAGTYGLYADAYRDAAAKLGILPRELQSITWEAIRSIFQPTFKTKHAGDVNEMFNLAKAGEITMAEARQRAFDFAGGLKPMPWEGTPAGIPIQDGGVSFLDKIDEVPQLRRTRTMEEIEPKDSIKVSLSAATSKIPGIKALYEKAEAGDMQAHALLQDIALDNLTHLLKGTSAKIKNSPATGLYAGSSEPSLLLSVTFDEKDRASVLAGVAKFADNFRQEQIHVRQGTKEKAGVQFEDGSYVTPVYTWELSKALSRKEIQKIIDQSGLYGLTFGDNFVEAYYVGDAKNATAIADFHGNAGRADSLLGTAGGKVARSLSRLWPYGHGDGAIGYERINGDVAAGPSAESKTAKRVAEYLAGTEVKTFKQPKEITKKQDELQTEIAKIYEALPDNDLKNPRVRKAYTEATKELRRQFDALPVKVEMMIGNGEPYANSKAMRRDLLDNNHLFIFATEADTFGPEGSDFTGHPLLDQSGLKDINGNPMVYNDLLRAVHDYYAHSLSPTEFGPKGEEAAWKNHMAMTSNPWARWAITSETRGQNSWVNFNDGLDRASSIKDRPFARQKVVLLPASYSLTGDKFVDLPMQEFIDKLPEKHRGGSVRFSARDDLGYYSALAKGIDAMPTKAATAGAWKDQIKGLVNKGAAKQDEITWSGLDDFLDLQEGKVTKEQISDFLKANGVQVRETVMGKQYFATPAEAIAHIAETQGESEDWVRENWGYTDEREYIDLASSMVDDDAPDATKYSQYTLPGGENYREVLLTLPDKAAAARLQRFQDIDDEIHTASPERFKELYAERDALARQSSQSYSSSHWDQKNVLAHIRVNDRTDADGKKVLFVEEVQSDWGQQGKKAGFYQEVDREAIEKRMQAITARLREIAKGGDTATASEQEEWNRLSDEKSQLTDSLTHRSTVPLGPFVTKTDGWLNLALKRIVTMAVDGSYDKVAFVNGEQSAERYDLSKQLDSVEYRRKQNGGGRLVARDNNDSAVVDQVLTSDDQLEDYLGKEAASKLLAQEPVKNALTSSYTLNNSGLKVGGEGMKAFYDKIVPNAMSALLKKTGGGKLQPVAIDTQMRMGEFDIFRKPGGAEFVLRSRISSTDAWSPNGRYPTREAAEQRMAEIKAEEVTRLSPQPGFDVTDAMKEKVAAGQPLFSSREQDKLADPKTKYEGKKTSVKVKIEDTGEIATLIMDVNQTLDDYDSRQANMQKLLECL